MAGRDADLKASIGNGAVPPDDPRPRAVIREGRLINASIRSGQRLSSSAGSPRDGCDAIAGTALLASSKPPSKIN